MSDETNTPETAQDDTTAEGSTDTAKEASEEIKPEGSETSEEGDKETESKDSEPKDGEKSEGEEESEEEEESGAPESYEKFELPEGVEMTDEQFKEVSEFSQSLNLNQEQAQQAVNYHNEVVGRVLADAKEEANIQRMKTQEDWVNQVKGDKEIGGAAMKENLSVALKSLNAFSDNAVDATGKPVLDKAGLPVSKIAQALQESGFGDHPEMVRVFYRVGKLISEDSYLSGKAPTGAPKTQAETMYPDQGKA